MKVWIAAVAALLFGGCSAAGPFVTNISSDGFGNLIVERNMVHMNAFMGTVSLGENPQVQTLRLSSPSAPVEPQAEKEPEHFSIRPKK